MFDSSGFPAAEVQFDKDAIIVGSADAVLDLAADPAITDLVVMSHGWNNDIADARSLYGGLAARLRTVTNAGAVPGLAGRNIGLAAVFWPSKKFTDQELIPGGAAAAGSSVTEADVREAIDEIRDIFTAPGQQAALDEAGGLISQLEDKATAREKFAATLLSILDRSAAEPEDATTDMFGIRPGTLMERLAVPAVIAPPTPATGGAAAVGIDPDGPAAIGGAAGLGSTLGGVLGAAKNLLNGVTYYQMKARAGTIGESGLAPLVTRIRSNRSGLRVHLVGHSFGGRVVTATTNKLPQDSVASLTLLQAAFSHYGFADQWRPGKAGGFRDAITKNAVAGPILITHTANDRAVGIAYAIASRIAGQNASAVGDANDTYGGIGRNGAQKTPEAVFARLLDVRGGYPWQDRRIHNLLADEFIKGHSDIQNDQVAYALLSAIGST